MKKNVYLMILIVSVLSFACTSNVETEKPDEVPEVLVENDKVIVERLSGISNELVFLQKEYLKPNLKSSKNIIVNFNEVLKYRYKNSNLEFFFFEVSNNSTQSVVALKSGNKVLFVLSTYNISDGITLFSLGTINDQDYFEISLNDRNEVLDFNDSSVSLLKNEINKLLEENTLIKSAQRPTCDESTTEYWECIKCSVRELTDDMVGNVACSIFVSSCLTAAAIHCL